jgi:hypothetical protein
MGFANANRPNLGQDPPKKTFAVFRKEKQQKPDVEKQEKPEGKKPE